MKLNQVFNKKKSEEEKQIDIIKNSEFFDTKWYLEKNPDVKSRRMSAARHYLRTGWKENRDPSPKFKTKEYLKKYPECKICPLVFEHNRNSFVDLAICAIMKNEGPYVKEWIDYHRLVGVKRFYIYDNESTDNMYRHLLPYIEQGIVVYKYYPGEARQVPAYDECLEEYRDKMQWLAIIDADEFIVPKEKNTIPEFLKNYVSYPGVGINWIMFDSNGHKRKPQGGVLENYTRVHYDDVTDVHFIKSIVQPKEVEYVGNAHYCVYKNGKHAVNECKNEIIEGRTDLISRKKIQINHYFSKSKEEFYAKVDRGMADHKKGEKRSVIKTNYEYDDYKYNYDIYKYLQKLKPTIAKREKIKYCLLKLINKGITVKHWFKRDKLALYIDEKWYFSQYPEAKKSGLSAKDHYFSVGWKLGYNPSAKFDTNFYLKKYPDIANVNMNPLTHYVKYGKNENRLPLPQSKLSSKQQTRKLQESSILKGDKIGEQDKINKHTCQKSGFFGKHIFSKQKSPENPLWNNVEYFDEQWYLKQYPEVLQCGTSAKEHYRQDGWLQRYNPSEKFNTSEYLKQYPECKICPIDFEYNRNGYVDLAACAIMKNEAPYVKEWIDYHRLVGVKRFYIYDNESTDNMEEVLTPYIEQGIVVYKYYPGKAAQMPVYNDCIKNYKDKAQWLAIIDTDEFIVPIEKNSIPEFLQDYQEYPGVGINWVMFDSNGHKKKPRGGVLENYTRAHYDERIVPIHLIKSIVQPTRVEKITNPHFGLFIDGELAVDENKEPIKEKAYTVLFSVNKIRLNHYYTKSQEESEAKVQRGTADSKTGRIKKIMPSELNIKDYKYDYSVYKYLRKLKPSIAKREKIKYLWLQLLNKGIVIKHWFKKDEPALCVDEKWYFNQYPEVKASGLSAKEHYFSKGWRLGYNPSAKFDTNFYLKKYPDIAKAQMNPLTHYIKYGKAEGRLPLPTVKETTKIKSKVQTEDSLFKGFKIWCKVQKKLATQTCQKFSTGLKNIFSKKKSQENPLWNNAEYFDEQWYLKQYPEVQQYRKGPKEHYRQEGWIKGYNPSSKFNTKEYLTQYPECKICPLDFKWSREQQKENFQVTINSKYTANPIRYMLDLVWSYGNFYKDKQLSANIYPNATFLPIISRNDGSPWFRGGILDKNNQYVEEVVAHLNKAIVYKDYPVPENIPYVDEDVIYIGSYWNHYGHFVVEELSQIWYILKNKNINLKLCYSMVDNQALPTYMQDTFKLLGISSEKLLRITQPTKFKSIIVPETCSLTNLWYTKEYKMIYDIIRDSVPPIFNEKIYLSRTHFKKAQETEFGEWYIENLFAANGYKIIYPEELSFIEQLSIIKGAKTVACISGSLLHQMLFAQDGTELIVIQQFSTINGAQRPINDMRKLRVTYIDAFIGLPNIIQGRGPYLIINTNFLQQFIIDNNFKTVEYNAINMQKDIGNYVAKWQEYAKNGNLRKELTLEEQKSIIEEFRIKYLNDAKNIINLPHENWDLFDSEWYAQQYPHVINSGQYPFYHYMKEGWKLGYNPSSRFDGNAYLKRYSDVARNNKNPLLHYIQFGKKEGRIITPVEVRSVMHKSCSEVVNIWNNKEYFDENWYIANYMKAGSYKKRPKAHYRAEGWKKGYNASEKFKTEEYLIQYPECKICPLDFEQNRNGYVDLAVCAIMKNEAPYVKEWIDYHLLLGVKRFYIYDNESEDNLAEALKPYIEQGIVVYKYYPGEAKQLPAYNEFIKEYSDKNEWVAFIDADEFIVPLKKKNIPEFLSDYENYAGVGVNWLCYDSNNHKIKPSGGLLENYTRCHYDNNVEVNHHIKTIAHPYLINDFVSPHFPCYRNDDLSVTENKEFITGVTSHGSSARAFTSKVSLQKIRINHYMCKSEEEYKEKIAKGLATQKRGVKYTFQKSVYIYNDYKYDYCIYKYLLKLKPKIAVRETFKFIWLNILNVKIKLNHYFRIKKSCIDEKWYFKHYPDAKESGLSATDHYKTIGWKKGYNPNIYFDTNFYLEKYKDVANAGINPFEHYLGNGQYEGRLPKATKGVSKNIFSSMFSRQVENVVLPMVNKNDAKYQLLDKSELFDKKWYTKKYLKGKNIDPIEHYLTVGWKEGCNPCLGFDGNAYLERYKDVKNVGMNPLVHYLNFGQKEGRQCVTFYSWWNRILNPYIGKSDVYITIAKSGLFDKKYYLNNHRNAIPQGTDPLEHYLTRGWKEGKNPSKEFKGGEYLKINPDVANANVNPLHHYVETGKKEGRIYKIRLPENCSAITKCIFKLMRLLRSTNKVNRILLVSHELTYTGAPLSLLKTAQCLSEMGYSLKILSLKDGDLRKEFEKYGKVIISDNIDTIVLAAANCDFVIINTMVNYCEYSMLSKLLPTVWWIREPHNMLDMYRYRYIKQILRFANNVYTMSDFSRQEFLAYNPNISVIKHGYDDEYRHKPIDTNELSFAVIGSIDERKGQDIFAEAIRLLPEEKRHKAKFYIVGKKHNIKYYDSLKIGLDGILEIMEPITEHKDMLSFYEKISCVVIPSREEPTSRVAIEAMMMARPAIMSDQVGAQYLYNGRNGAIFKNENAEQLSKLIEDIIDNPQKLEEMSVEARKAYMENNSIEVYKKNLQKMINSTSMPVIEVKKLLVHLHLYYHEQLDYFISKLKNITCDYDLYITYVEKNEASETKLKKFKPEAKLVQVENKGYDLYPFIEVLSRVNLDDYSYILKMHTKNYRTNYWSYNGVNYIHYQWRNALVNALIGNKRIFKNNLKVLAKEYIGMIGNKDLISHKGAKDNEEYRLKMCEKLGYDPQYDEYIAGTMFLCKSFLMKDIQNLHLTINDFDFSNSSGVVGTLAHAMESIVGHTVQNNGLDIYGHFVFSFHRFVSYIQNQYKIYQKSKVLPPYEAIKKSKYFDAKWYLRRYPDVAKAGADPVKHYLESGWKEGRDPSPFFITNWYLGRYRDIKEAHINPLLHYEQDGKYEGRSANASGSMPTNILCYPMWLQNERKRLSRKKQITGCNLPIVVSLTTYPKRIYAVIETIKSIFAQTRKADKIILWLTYEEFPKQEKELPSELLELTKYGLTIGWCHNLRSYNKLLPSLEKYPNALHVTVDDDIIYKPTLIEKLYANYLKYPNDIQCHRVTKFYYDKGYRTAGGGNGYWPDGSNLNKLTGVGGVLYPVGCFYKDIFNVELIKKLSPTNDDHWFWFQAVLNGRKIRVVDEADPSLEYVDGSQETGLYLVNDRGANLFWKDFNRLMEYYPQMDRIFKNELMMRKLSNVVNIVKSYILLPYNKLWHIIYREQQLNRPIKDKEYYSKLLPSQYPEELAEWYKRTTGYELNLNNPRTFNEKIQWLKLYDSTPKKTRLADKYLVRKWVKDKIGEKYLIPLLGVYDSFEEINFDKLPNQFVIKCNHGSGWNIIVKDKAQLDLKDTKEKLDKWMNSNFAFEMGLELHYRDMKPKIIIEKYMDDGTGDLRDYKYTCFDGKPEFIWIDSDRHTEHKRNLYDLSWKQLDCKINSHYDTFPSPEKPKKLAEMNKLAAQLSQGFPYVRVDFYIINEKIYFGEITFTSSSGVEDITPYSFEYRLSEKIKLPDKIYNLTTRQYETRKIQKNMKLERDKIQKHTKNERKVA